MTIGILYYFLNSDHASVENRFMLNAKFDNQMTGKSQVKGQLSLFQIGTSCVPFCLCLNACLRHQMVLSVISVAHVYIPVNKNKFLEYQQGHSVN